MNITSFVPRSELNLKKIIESESRVSPHLLLPHPETKVSLEIKEKELSHSLSSTIPALLPNQVQMCERAAVVKAKWLNNGDSGLLLRDGMFTSN